MTLHSDSNRHYQTMTEELFKVVLTGEFTGEFEEPLAKARFARMFRLDKKRVDRLFAGGEQVIKSNVTEDMAMKFTIKVLEAGCECYVQEIPDQDEPEYVEKRQFGERRVRFRRAPRFGSIIPDRRMKLRRKRDRRVLKKLLREGHEIPLALDSYPPEAATE